MELPKPFYSPAEVAELAGVHPSTILNYIRDGRLYAVRLSERTIRIPSRSVMKLLSPEDVVAPRMAEKPNADVRDAMDAAGGRSENPPVPA